MSGQDQMLARMASVQEQRQMLAEAMTPGRREAFEFTDMVDFVRGQVFAREFTSWVVERFYEVAEAGFEFEVMQGRKTGSFITVERPTSGWVSWSMVQDFTGGAGWHGLMGEVSRTRTGEQPFVLMKEYTAGDRGGSGTYGPVVAFPLDVMFGERERAERYVQYLALKAEFEGSES